MEAAGTQNRSADARMVDRKEEEGVGTDGAPGVADAATSSLQKPVPCSGTETGICDCGPSAACGVDAAAVDEGEPDAAAAAERVLELEQPGNFRRIERRWPASG